MPTGSDVVGRSFLILEKAVSVKNWDGNIPGGTEE